MERIIRIRSWKFEWNIFSTTRPVLHSSLKSLRLFWLLSVVCCSASHSIFTQMRVQSSVRVRLIITNLMMILLKVSVLFWIECESPHGASTSAFWSLEQVNWGDLSTRTSRRAPLLCKQANTLLFCTCKFHAVGVVSTFTFSTKTLNLASFKLLSCDKTEEVGESWPSPLTQHLDPSVVIRTFRILCVVWC